jgi:hypothetical protein
MTLQMLRPVWLLVLIGALACHRPGWETVLTVPVVSRRFTIADLEFVPFVHNVVPGPNGVLQLDVEYALDTLHADDLLGPLSGSGNTVFAVPDFVISPVGSTRAALPAAGLAGVPVQDSAYLPLPPFVADTTLPIDLPGIDSVAAASAVLRFAVDNRTDIAFDSVLVELPFARDPVFAAPLGPRTSGERRSVIGPAVLGALTPLRVRAVSPGSGGQPVWLRARDSLVLSLTVDSLRVEAGRLAPPRSSNAEAQRDDTLFLHGSTHIRVDSALIGRGFVRVGLANDLAFGVRCSLALEEVGQEHMVDLAPRDSLSWIVDLSAAMYGNRNRDSSQLTLACRLNGTFSGEPVELGPGDGFRVSAAVDSVALDYARGWATDTVWSPVLADSLEWVVAESLRELPIRFSSVRLAGEVASGFNLGGLFDLTLQAHAPGVSESESVRFVLPPGTPGQPGTGRFEAEIARLMNIVPERLTVSGRAGLVGRAEFWRESFVTGAGAAVVPLRVKVLPHTYRVGPWEVPLDSVLRKFARSYIRTAEVEAAIANHLPLGVEVELQLWSGGQDTIRVPVAVPAAPLDPVGGWAVAATDTTVVARLDSTGVAVLQLEPCWAALALHFPETDTIALRSVDYFQVDPALLRINVDVQER